MVSRSSFINTESALAEAGVFAQRMLGFKNTGAGSFLPTVRHEHYHWGSPTWGYYPQPAYYVAPGSGYREEKNDHAWAAIPAAAIALVTMYFIGQNHAEWSQATAGIAKLRQKNRDVQAELGDTHSALKNKMQWVFEKQMGILERIRSDSYKGLIFKSIFVTSVIAAGIGAMASGGIVFAAALEPLLKYGIISALITSCAMIYRAGFNSRDDAIYAEAQELEIVVHTAARDLKEVS